VVKLLQDPNADSCITVTDVGILIPDKLPQLLNARLLIWFIVEGNVTEVNFLQLLNIPEGIQVTPSEIVMSFKPVDANIELPKYVTEDGMLAVCNVLTPSNALPLMLIHYQE
jgi:hypothetical protein